MLNKPISQLEQEFYNAEAADRPNRLRGIRNTLAMTGVDGVHWSAEERAELIKGGFDVDGTYSVIGKFIRSLGSTFLDNSFNPRYLPNPENGIDLALSSKVNNIYISEKNKRRYRKSKISALQDGLIYRGVEEIFIERPVMGDPRTWGINYRHVRSDEIIFDQGSKSDDIAAQSSKCWQFSYHSIEEIKKMYPDKQQAIQTLLQYGTGDENGEGAEQNGPKNTPHDVRRKTKYNKFQVVSAYELVTEMVKSSIYIGEGNMVPIPDFGYKGNDETIARNLWAMEHNYNIDEGSGNVLTVEDPKSVLYVSVFMPHLDLMLDKGEDERQLDRLPFFTWSYQTIYGISSGMVDLLWSTHRDIHKREAAKTKYLEKTPLQKPYVHQELFDGNQKQLQAFINDWSDSDKPLILRSDIPPGMADRYMGVTPGVEIPSIVTQDESFKLQLLNEISGQTAASFGKTERSGESGTLNKQKAIESDAVQRFPLEMDSEYELAKNAAWLKLAPKVYAGTANYNRAFGDEVANILSGFEDDGAPIVTNDLSNIDVMEVDVVKDKDSDYYKQRMTDQAMGYLQNITPSETNRESISLLTQQLLVNRNFNSPADEAYTKEVTGRMREMDKLNAEALIAEAKARISAAASSVALTPSRTGSEAATNEANTVQAQASIAQMQPPTPPQGGEGIPQESAPIPQQ